MIDLLYIYTIGLVIFGSHSFWSVSRSDVQEKAKAAKLPIPLHTVALILTICWPGLLILFPAALLLGYFGDKK
jgi:hypothetical protein